MKNIFSINKNFFKLHFKFYELINIKIILFNRKLLLLLLLLLQMHTRNIRRSKWYLRTQFFSGFERKFWIWSLGRLKTRFSYSNRQMKVFSVLLGTEISNQVLPLLILFFGEVIFFSAICIFLASVVTLWKYMFFDRKIASSWWSEPS